MKKAKPHTYFGWGIELDDYDRRFIVGIGYSPALSAGEAPDWTYPIHTLILSTRAEARDRLRAFRAGGSWAFEGKRINEGGNRIYRGARVVKLSIVIAVTT